MGRLFDQITQQEYLLASYKVIKEKWHDFSFDVSKRMSPGIDGVDFAEFDRNLAEQIAYCREMLLNPDREFHPQILTLVPKEDPSKYREIFLLTLRDKVVHKAIADALSAHLDRFFYPNLYSFRKGKYYGAIPAARKVRKLLEAHQHRLHIFKTDIAQFFESIDPQCLLQKYKTLLPDEPEILRLLEKYLRQKRCEKGVLYSPIFGIPTGSSLSPLSGNLYLNELDAAMFRGGFHYLRYADDLILLDENKQRMEAGRQVIESILARHGLKVSPKKTHLLNPGEPFDYVGYRFENGKIHVGTTSMRRFREWVQEILPRDRYPNHPRQTLGDRRNLLSVILKDLNTGMMAMLNPRQLPWIRGFPIVNDDSSFREMDRFIKNRIRSVIMGHCSLKNYKLVPEAWFRELGYKSLTGAYYRIVRRRSLAPYHGWRRYFGTNFEAFLGTQKKKTSLGLKLLKMKEKWNAIRKAFNGELKF